jgi:hypothetical protein
MTAIEQIKASETAIAEARVLITASEKRIEATIDSLLQTGDAAELRAAAEHFGVKTPRGKALTLAAEQAEQGVVIPAVRPHLTEATAAGGIVVVYSDHYFTERSYAATKPGMRQKIGRVSGISHYDENGRSTDRWCEEGTSIAHVRWDDKAYDDEDEGDGIHCMNLARIA